MKIVKSIPLVFIFTFIIINSINVNCQNQDPSTKVYEDLLKKVKEQELQLERERIAKEKGSVYEKDDYEKVEPEKPREPKSPAFVPSFWCDPDIKLNTVRDEEMKILNYNK